MSPSRTTTSAATSSTSRVASALWAVIALVVITAALIAAFAPAQAGAFLNWDDDRNIVQNHALQTGSTPPWRWAWSTYHLGVWQPLAWLLLWAQWRTGAGQPGAFHSMSIALHAANCMLLYFLILRFIRIIPAQLNTAANFTRCASLASAMATLLFAIHPLRVEPVAWISAQPYLPSIFFYMLAVFIYLGDADSEGRRRMIRCAASLACFCMALGFKAVAISLPVVLLVLDIYPLRRRARAGWKIVLEKIPFFAIAAVAAWWALEAKDFSESRVPIADTQLTARFVQGACGLLFYLQKSLIPIGLGPYYRLPSDATLMTWPYLVAIFAALGITVIFVALARRWPALLVAWVVYFVILLPNLGVVQISQQIAADRYSYLAVIPWFVLLAVILFRVLAQSSRPSVPAMVLAVLAVIATVASIRSTRSTAKFWSSSESLWSRSVDLDPNCAVSHCNLGAALIQKGELAPASTHLSRAIELEPGFSFAYSNFAAILCKVGRYDDAIAAAHQALSAEPPLSDLDAARTHAVLGEAYAAQRNDELAWSHTLKARELGFDQADRMIEYLKKVSRDPRQKVE